MKKNNTYILIFLIFIGFVTIVSYWDSIQDSYSNPPGPPDTPLDLAAIEKMIAEERNKPCEHKKFTTLLDYIEGFKNDNKITLDIANDLSNKLYTMYAQKIKQEARQSLSSNLNDQNRIVNCLNEIGSSSFAHNDRDYNFYMNQYKAINSYIQTTRNYTDRILSEGFYDENDFFISEKFEEAKATIENLNNISPDFQNNEKVQSVKYQCLEMIENVKKVNEE